jgi:outer membrane biosynthesis protein TonB
MTDPEAPEAAPRRDPRQTVGKGPVVGSVFVHTSAIFLAWWASATPAQVPDFVAFEIELISPPAAELGERTTPPPEELVIETPLDPVPEPQEEIPPAVIEEEAPADEPPTPEETVAPPDVELVDDPEPPTSPNPDPDVETPGEELNVRLEGLRRDYPVYYENIIRQMQRCFRWRGEEDLTAKVYFVINRDGSVSEVDILESSRSIAFDIEAMGAAECAGDRGRLGPLPEALPFDRLPVSFTFSPRARRDSDSEG